jgi:hypothetical protein
VDSAQLLLLDPANLPGESEAYYQRVVDVTVERGAGEVKFVDDDIGGTHGVAVETKSDGEFPVYVEYVDAGTPTAVRIDLFGAE